MSNHGINVVTWLQFAVSRSTEVTVLDDYRFAGYRIAEFSPASKEALHEIADRLIPFDAQIINKWVAQQYKAWQPPGFTKENLTEMFGQMLQSMLRRMHNRELELCILELEDIGSNLAKRHFPFEALVISIHFLEESYMPYLLNNPSPTAQNWLIRMDEFLHAVLAALATAYFSEYRRELLNEAEVGKIVQEGLLADIPRHASDLEIAHIYLSAREQAKLGGDFLDFFEIDDSSSAFFIGDLSGHGVEAAADSVMLRSLFKGFMRENPNMVDAMSRLNTVLETDLKPGLFATALAITYQLPGHLSLVSAGHPYPVLCDDECRLLELSGPALAIIPSAAYSIGTIELKPGSVFAAYTDGLLEARVPRGEIFGEQRILSAVSESKGTSARNIAENLLDTALRFAGGTFTDDVALLVLKRSAQ